MVQQSLEDFYAAVDSDPRILASQDAWRECMGEAGHPYASSDDMSAEIYGDDSDFNRLQQEFYESQAWMPGSPDHAQWQELVDEEIGIAVANARCSEGQQEIYREVIAELRPELVAAWQTIDWDLPPVTFAGDGPLATTPGVEGLDG
jgi:hypothetical protein